MIKLCGRRISILLIAATITIISGCSLGGGDTDDIGSVFLGSEDVTPQGIIPPVDTIPERYEVSGTGPEGQTFSVEWLAFPAVLPDLDEGQWNISVVAVNAGGQPVAQGNQVVQVTAGVTQVTSIVMSPVAGPGLVSVEVSWVESHIGIPSISAVLVDESGGSTAVSVPLESPGSAAGVSVPIPAGYYTFEVKLLDGGIEVMGATESVLVVTNTTTVVTLPFDEINRQAMRIEKIGDRFTLEWDPPADEALISAYNIHSRDRTGGDWQLLTQVPAGPSPSLEVTSTQLAYGIYEMAVQSVYTAGAVSALHTSLDVTADPATGWYLDWKANP